MRGHGARSHVSALARLVIQDRSVNTTAGPRAGRRQAPVLSGTCPFRLSAQNQSGLPPEPSVMCGRRRFKVRFKVIRLFIVLYYFDNRQRKHAREDGRTDEGREQSDLQSKISTSEYSSILISAASSRASQAGPLGVRIFLVGDECHAAGHRTSGNLWEEGRRREKGEMGE